MLETRHLTKIYRTKKGVPVTALSDVSLKFSDTGMVFLLGKSGSGKSTLLNLLGGLDKYDSGEIIIKGVSSSDFRQRHFDSYRNTYVGFIFQEYNILEEFTVGANIALALELQGKKATDGEINKILSEVDLQGYGARRPNELSGGQKQRVAIARALVKNPKIIMADEPSGALDSATGKQVFETLKKLSKEKLVIVVSHDRDFADTYGDRIIELGDGKVISDTTVCAESDNATVGISFEGTTAKIPADYRLTEEDRIAINEYLEKLNEGVNLEFISKNFNRKFAPTEQDKIESKDKSPFKLIKSKLSLKHAFKIGASGLKHKKFRLVMTIFLSCISFVLFGLVDTFSSYNHIKTTANSIYDSGITYASVSKNILMGEGIDSYWSNGKKMTDEDISSLSSNTGVEFKGVYSNNRGGTFHFQSNIGDKENMAYNAYGLNIELTYFSGILEANETDLEKQGYTLLAGKMPDGEKNEIAISKYVFESFEKYGYREVSFDELGGLTQGKTIEITQYSDLIGKTLYIDDEVYEISGVIDTHFDKSRYESLMLDSGEKDAAGTVFDMVLYTEFDYAVSYNYTGMMIVGNGFLDRYFASHTIYTDLDHGSLMFQNENFSFNAYGVAKLQGMNAKNIVWRDEERTILGENEIIVSADLIMDYVGAAYFDDDGNVVVEWDKIDQGLTLDYEDFMGENEFREDGYTIVGMYDNLSYEKSGTYGMVILPNILFEERFYDYDGRYDFAVGAMPESKDGIQKLAEYCYTQRDKTRFSFNNPASFELDSLDEVIQILAKVFLYIGLAFALFASILLSNFIATSISYKKQEIGILRAIGSRGNDVFRIFFAESFIIAMINFVLACVGTSLITNVINNSIRDLGLLVTVLNFGVRQILILFVVSVAVAFIASFLPVKKIASKKPIDAIRNR